jgi:hypothetical protein
VTSRRDLKEIMFTISVAPDATAEQIDAFARAVEVQAEDLVDDEGESLGDLPVLAIAAVAWEPCEHCQGKEQSSPGCGKCRGLGKQSRSLL